MQGTREQAQALLGQLSGRVQALGLQLKAEKTAVTHIDEGFVFRSGASSRYLILAGVALQICHVADVSA